MHTTVGGWDGGLKVWSGKHIGVGTYQSQRVHPEEDVRVLLPSFIQDDNSSSVVSLVSDARRKQGQTLFRDLRRDIDGERGLPKNCPKKLI